MMYLTLEEKEGNFNKSDKKGSALTFMYKIDDDDVLFLTFLSNLK